MADTNSDDGIFGGFGESRHPVSTCPVCCVVFGQWPGTGTKAKTAYCSKDCEQMGDASKAGIPDSERVLCSYCETRLTTETRCPHGTELSVSCSVRYCDSTCQQKHYPFHRWQCTGIPVIKSNTSACALARILAAKIQVTWRTPAEPEPEFPSSDDGLSFGDTLSFDSDSTGRTLAFCVYCESDTESTTCGNDFTDTARWTGERSHECNGRSPGECNGPACTNCGFCKWDGCANSVIVCHSPLPIPPLFEPLHIVDGIRCVSISDINMSMARRWWRYAMLKRSFQKLTLFE